MAFYLERSEKDPQTAFLGVEKGPVKGFAALRWGGEEKKRATLRALAFAAAVYGKHRSHARAKLQRQKTRRPGRFGR